MEESRTDETLMLAYRDGDAAAFEVLYARHRGRLFRYLLHQCGRREQADEMFQEIWMSVIRARSGYEVSAKFTTWLFRIAHNRLIDGFRARGRLAEFEVEVGDAESDPPDYPAPDGEQPERLFDRAQLAGRLVTAIEALPPPQREAFLLAAEGGLTIEEIGNATGTGFETAKSRLRYAYARLRNELGDLR
ncbi:RNA polymerase sigma factor [Propionivibrio sp.]|uniref:RNA polymerase sigma factor n=1 Tax=Propionivibrio sp. TaxID=2212460 RepID=UPI003BF19550